MQQKEQERERLDFRRYNMNKEQRDREKELKYLIYLKNELLKETKKELQQYRRELQQLGDNKVLRKKLRRKSNEGIYQKRKIR